MRTSLAGLVRPGLIVCTIFLVAGAVFAQRQKGPAKAAGARVIAEGTFEEIFEGKATGGSSLGSVLRIRFSASRWFKMTTGDNGQAEFLELEGAPVPAGSGEVSFSGTFKGVSSGGSVDATRSFAGNIGPEHLKIGAPEYSGTGEGLRVSVILTPKMKGRCFSKVISGDQQITSIDCANGVVGGPTAISYAETAGSDKTSEINHTASFEMTLELEPTASAAGKVTGDPAVDAAIRSRLALEQTMQDMIGTSVSDTWRGATTSGSQEAGFKIQLTGQKQLPSADGSGKITRKLTMTVTIIPGSPQK